METFLMLAVVILGVIALSAVLGLLVAFPVMLLWNWVIPSIFHLPTITYWQAYGLYLLSAILFKSSSSSSKS